MLFNSYEFLFVLLPLTLLVYYQLGERRKYEAALYWLVFVSLVFYGWWNPAYLLLILSSIVCNYFLGRQLSREGRHGRGSGRVGLMVIGVCANLAAIGYFKYANFFVDNTNVIFSSQYHLEQIILPLAISFFTFQQITFLVDAFRGETREPRFINYCLFVTFFPQLIAGPIVHHKEMLPQFLKSKVFQFEHRKLAIGLSIFVVGLFKKVVIADSIAVYATPVFNAAVGGLTPTFFEAWGAALAYTLQLYFDFSGYSDMAVGLAYMFGIRLAINFFSPYKAVNIIEFWHRWHISLSRFLREYVYISLGGNRKGVLRRYQNLFITMLLGGLWHGAGWTFVAWGALHGAFLVANNAWHKFRSKFGRSLPVGTLWGRGLSRVLTFLAVTVGWVVFRAESLPAAVSIFEGMVGMNGFSLPESYLDYFNAFFGSGDWLRGRGWEFTLGGEYFGGVRQFILILLLLFWAWFAPNIYQFMGRHSPALDISAPKSVEEGKSAVGWAPEPRYALLVFAMFLVVLFQLDKTSEFLYFQF